jgi:OPA family glycerol-3-phosphate transporter-like MFS transporter 3
MLGVTIPWIYAVLFGLNGAFQSTVWPGTVAVIANWFPKTSRGSVMGIWSTNASVGDIFGQQTAAVMMGSNNFQWEYVILITVMYILVSGGLFLFIEDKPAPDMLPTKQAREVTGPSQEIQNSDSTTDQEGSKKGISFWKAWKLPG